jgi:REP-associated tyrosine transposase
MMGVKEKRHRLPKEFYVGEISVAFTLCLKGEIQAFAKPEIVKIFTDILTSVVTTEDCFVPVYCFMPDHQHLILTGITGNSNVWGAVVKYKQKTGFWMSENKPELRWQKDFYDHIIRKKEDIAAQVRYLLNNPVREGLVSMWQEYPFKGSIGCELEDILLGII